MSPVNLRVTMLVLVLIMSNVASFTTPKHRFVVGATGVRGPLYLSSEESNNNESSDVPPQTAATFVPGSPTAVDADTSLPIPSPLLLGGAMVLGIAATGSIFELTSGDPKLGFATTAAIVAIGLPGCLLLFLAAIKKATEETEEDDKRFMGK